MKILDVELKDGAIDTYAPGWQRCERTSYHDSTKTGTYY